MSSFGASRAQESDDALSTARAPQVSTSGVDDLLDEIDSLLEENAEAFVKSFVQKGGQ
jgi:ubiquitin-like protein Pup